MSSGPAVAKWPRGACNSDLMSLKDDQLLNRFFKEREDAAFAVLVERYGPLVYGVCRRILSDSNDAEDAFQATFLCSCAKGERSAIRGGWRIGSSAWPIARLASCG